ncbi:asparaginase [Halomarina ordinaria]|uniref:L-asparaginase n=1 Tax=Halomarina ordinaria TaxID=3033939 RepID=A0ABD5U9J9_9EURY|nr:asparaginase [Halomarina sp. PSRA2]
MANPTVAVLGTGGTIASSDTERGAEAKRDAADLLDAVPDLADHADLRVEEVAKRLSFEMDFETVLALAERVEGVSERVDGIVVTHGTDTMAECAFALDHLREGSVPVVFTGAQRHPDLVSADGPANLLAAVRSAADDRLREAGGTYVAFDEELHAASTVEKLHTSALGGFESPTVGPVASLLRHGVEFHRPAGSDTPRLAVDTVTAHVPVVSSGLGVDDATFRRELDAGADGIVLEATGIGNTSPSLGRAVDDAVSAGVPVVVASRSPAGRVQPVYGSPGGSRSLSEYGALCGGRLSAAKARVRLLLALSRTDRKPPVAALFPPWHADGEETT